MIKYVALISLIFAILFYILILLIFGSRLKCYFTINYIIGYMLMVGNFLLMAKKFFKTEKFRMFFCNSLIRLVGFFLLLLIWIKFGSLNLIGLIAGLTSFVVSIPIAALFYTKFRGSDGTSN